MRVVCVFANPERAARPVTMAVIRRRGAVLSPATREITRLVRRMLLAH